ncbi:hypothetical protein [Bacillus sp. JCM 19041]|uniref:hypothetical protein n=1 Tax=Bacillus sp. JCM 19041 TaxID=1460637 RepID=UPI0006D286FC
MKRTFILFALLIMFIVKTPVVLAESPNNEINDEDMRAFLTEIFKEDDYKEYGFETESVEKFSYGEPVAIYDINPSFAFGESEEMYHDKVEEWVVVVYEDDKAVNGIKLRKSDDGQFEISGFGYPLTLAADVTELKGNEILIHEFPTGFYYALDQDSDMIRLLEEEVISTQPQDEVKDLTEEDFQTILEDRYDDVEKGDETISGFAGGQQEQQQSVWLLSSVGLSVIALSAFSIFVWKRKTT